VFTPRITNIFAVGPSLSNAFFQISPKWENEISASDGGCYGMLRRVVSQKLTEVLEMCVALMTEVAPTSGKAVNFYDTTLRHPRRLSSSKWETASSLPGDKQKANVSQQL
jgi:hypothetical protein